MSGFDTLVPVDQSRGRRDITVAVTEVSSAGSRVALGGPRTVTLTGACARVTCTSAEDEVLSVLARRVKRVWDLVAALPPAESRQVHVLVVTHDLGLGGGQLYLSELLAGLTAGQGFQFTLVCPKDGPLRSSLEAMGVEVHITAPLLLSPIRYECFLRELAGIAREARADVVLANTLEAFCGPDLASRIGLPSLWAIHESWPLASYWTAAHGAAGVHPYIDARARHALGSSSAVIFEAQSTCKLFAEHGDHRRLMKIDYGIPLGTVEAYVRMADRDELRRERGFQQDQLVILCLGTISPRKAQAALVRAFATVADQHTDAVLVLVGHMGDAYGDQVEQYVDRLTVRDRVRVVPVTPDTYEWYLMADVFVLPSSIESLPRSVLEAMAFGLPVAATNVFGLGELIEDGVNGLSFPPDDLAALIGSLDRMLRMTRCERDSLGNRGRAIVNEKHDSSGYVAAYKTLLRALAQDASAYPCDVLRDSVA